ncbi:MAG: hypothetical protein H6642_02590 [Caldilineaceae bacterium]|nr:hypothetical protein [Caldilineaceae bacterium]
MTTQPDNAPAIKGSWESKLEEAQRLAEDYNPAALPLYESLFTRLGKMPAKIRRAADGRLQDIFVQAGYGYQRMLTWAGQYADSIAVADRLIDELPEDDRGVWMVYQINLLVRAQKYDQTFEYMRRYHDWEEYDEIDALRHTAVVQLRMERPDDAAATLATLDQVIADRDVSREARQRDEAYAAQVGVELALLEKEFDRAEELFQKAIQDPAYRDFSRLYTEFIRAGEAERALPYIKRDQQHPIRAGFWHGLALRRLGNEAGAQARWEDILESDISDSDEESISEYILADYYLNGADGMGLDILLAALADESNVPWQVHALIGVGWLLRRNLPNARVNLRRAHNQYREFYGDRLPSAFWYHVTDLVTAKEAEKIAQYFDTVSDTASDIASQEQTA